MKKSNECLIAIKEFKEDIAKYKEEIEASILERQAISEKYEVDDPFEDDVVFMDRYTRYRACYSATERKNAYDRERYLRQRVTVLRYEIVRLRNEIEQLLDEYKTLTDIEYIMRNDYDNNMDRIYDNILHNGFVCGHKL